MTDLRELIRTLAAIPNGAPIVTLYLDTAWRDEHQRGRDRISFSDRAREARRLFGAESADGKAIAQTLDKIAPWLDDVINQAIHKSARGVCLAASVPRDLWIEEELPGGIGPELFVDSRPRVYPLAQLWSRQITELLPDRDFSLVHHVLRQGLSSRNGTAGLRPTLLAVNERRVRTLALSEGFDAFGFLCRNCNAAWNSGATACVFCGGETDGIALPEHLASRVFLESGDVAIVPRGGPLDAYEGIGSILRHLRGKEKQEIESEITRIAPAAP